ncbi:MAG TPA: chemotaxis-specific protein-glutamate methyltransferase CheB [Gemmataceae bacterium]|nr:chemotaxis-specific protein-glutamate methyltransferase CheB [Gemmataceae bacterium]
MSRPIRVVVVDDSPFVCRLMTSFLQSDQDVQVIATALDGQRAMEQVRRLKPDAVTLDLEMPGMNGLEVLDRIMHEMPTPVLIVSGVSRQGAAKTMVALEKGAVDFLLKYTPGVDTDSELLRREIVGKVRLASQIKVIRSLAAAEKPRFSPDARPSAETGVPPFLSVGIVVIGASTGGPQAVQTLLSHLPADFAGAVIVVQHMPAQFTPVLAAQLRRHVLLPVRHAADGDLLEPGLVFVAPGDRHLLVRGNGKLQVIEGPKVRGHRPCIDVTMQAVAEAFGPLARGIVMTGMGTDGTLGLEAIRRRGGRTYVQDPQSCMVSSMPSAARARGVVDQVAVPDELARLLEWTEDS